MCCSNCGQSLPLRLSVMQRGGASITKAYLTYTKQNLSFLIPDIPYYNKKNFTCSHFIALRDTVSAALTLVIATLVNSIGLGH